MFTKDGRRISYQAAVKEFQKRGCEAFGSSHNKPMDKETARAAKAIYDLLGDDMDGAASELEDL
jgi:peroxiredoxin